MSNPQDALFGKLSIVFETICSSTSYNANLQFNLSFKYYAQYFSPEYDIWLLRLKPILVKKLLNSVAMCNWFVISFPLMLRDLGKELVLWFLERISFIVFQVFLISDLYLLKVDSRKRCLASRMLLFNILL